MLKSIAIKNFKSIESVNLQLSALTLLAGANGSGKSSLIQTLLLLKQSFFNAGIVTLILNGEYARLGQAKLVEYNWSAEENGSVTTSLSYRAEGNGAADSSLQLDIEHQGDDDQRDVIKISIPQDVDLSFVERIRYLSADRLAPSDVFPHSSHEIDSANLGVRGQYTTAYLARNKLRPLEIEELIHPLSSKHGVAASLIANVQAWMQSISPGVEIVPSLEQKINASILEYQYAGGVSDLSSFNVGFGITYVLPVITRILMSKPGDILLLDNPEAHVHPRGQVELGKLIALAANCGIQIIVETHSDHLFNGIRLHIKEKPLVEPLQYSMYFVEREQFEDGHQARFASKFTHIELADDAKIVSAPVGFFDEWENTIFKLI
jgi:predicted ATPase